MVSHWSTLYDLSKAFNILNYSLLLQKLDAYGFSLMSTTFIQTYLNEKMQKFNVNNKCRVRENIYIGVSQCLATRFQYFYQ